MKTVNSTCEFCGKVFKHNPSLRRHVRKHHEFKCSICDMKFMDRTQFLKHQHLTDHTRKIEKTTIYCVICNKHVQKTIWPYHLRTNIHKENCAEHLSNDIKCVRSVFNNRIETYIFENKVKDDLIPEKFLTSITDRVIEMFKNVIQKHTSIKFNCELHCKYILMKEDEDVCKTDLFTHQSKMTIMNSSTAVDEIHQIYSNQCDVLMNKMSEFQERDSGWTLTEISHLEININQYKCMKGSHYICLPPTIMKKQACINVQNTDDEYCFKWAIISALYPVTISKRCSSYEIKDIKADIIVLKNNIVLNFENLDFPLAVEKIKDFELKNPEISINVFGLENGNIVGPYYYTQMEKTNHINLLLLEEEKNIHYVWIKNMSRWGYLYIYMLI